ncbi:PKD family protein [Chitinophaga skermanii]|uniref:PKD family protein n=1 Tax=Chitinophaga skermanii TaxID=331697 RepID=A0A327R2Q9_9BACT|nr:PKD-like family lipoprotein [Chitinophaga skermanii]RAJ11106.1 PKD family protein [Chitinophaga skermanii]
MKHFVYILFLVAVGMGACKKDLGNYTYTPPTEPVIKNFVDSTVNAMVGDSLIISPDVKLEGGDPLKDLEYYWEIIVAEEARAETYTGYPLRMVYNLKPMERNARLTITDKRNQLKYFYKFKVMGGTQFSKGTAVLSLDNGVTKLSFIRPDSTVNANLYFNLHNENLPSKPVQLYAKPLAYQANTVEDMWVICEDETHPSIILDGSTMLKKRTFIEQFFKAPTPMVTQYFEGSMGVPTGIINNKLYLSVTQTAPFAPDFGKFSSMVPGDYTLSKYFSRTPVFYFGFDMKSRAFVSFDGGGNYMGSDYTVTAAAFNPKSIEAGELIFMQAVMGPSYAYFKAADGKVYEYAMSVDMANYAQRAIKPIHKRVFKGSDLVTATTKWQRSAVDIFYFTSNDKIYRYNPVNEDLRALDANFGGKKVTMIQLNLAGTELTAGIDGEVLKLDVSVGQNGPIVSRVKGIPGEPVDIIIRK